MSLNLLDNNSYTGDHYVTQNHIQNKTFNNKNNQLGIRERCLA